jgi:glutamate carboxypeptidase
VTGYPAREIRGWLEQHLEEMVVLLGRLARAESPSVDAAAQRESFAILADELERLDFAVRPVRGRNVGDHLYARPRVRQGGAARQLVIGHMDTVWPLGTLARMPVSVEGDELFGPGVVDMKGGLVQLVFALRVLHALDLSPSLTPVVLVNADEEIGSVDSKRLIERLARGSERAFVLEAPDGVDGRLKIARKGVGRFRLTARGRASHAGASFEQGVSAILELSHQVQRLFALNDAESGVTVNVGTIDGGLRPNVVAPEASALVGVRAPRQADAERLERAIRSLRPVLAGSSLEIAGGFGRPPMQPRARNRALLETARRLGRELGLRLEDAGLVGGGSDANFASRYTATLDGLGAVGDGAHAVHEHVSISRMPERAALLALLLLEPAAKPAGRPAPGPARRRRRPRVAIVGGTSAANVALAEGLGALGVVAEVKSAVEAYTRLGPGDTAAGRLDVLPTLDGVEPGLLALLWLERRGVRVLNGALALLGAHDKLRTARLLEQAGIPHPATAHVCPGDPAPAVPLPLVLKPRFGSWGADVFRCDSPADLRRTLAEVRDRPWFRRHGALLQELVPTRPRDLRLLVAGGRVVGAIERAAAPGEWRTNISLGGAKHPALPSDEAQALAVRAAAAIGADFVGADLLALPSGGYVLLELNGAVDFDSDYSLPGANVYSEIAEALDLSRAAPATGECTRRRVVAA